MARVSEIKVQHVRNHTDKNMVLSSNTTIITGKNGTGKTSLIEALYIALQGSSFRGSDSEILQHDQVWYRTDIIFSDGSQRTVKYDSLKPTGKKMFTIDGKNSYRLSADNKAPIVLFEPEDLRLISGSPARRRFFIDHLISQIDPEYARSMRRYERALRQRNNLLKHHSINKDELFVWNIALSEYGAYVTRERIGFIEKINQQISDMYQSISETSDIVSIHYSRTFIDDIKQKILSELMTSIDRDRLLGYTTIGPHRDDVVFQYNTSLAHTVCSRGEMRTIILGLKLIEKDLIEEMTDISPIILLDDVFSELDGARRLALTEALKDYQTFITTTDADAIAQHLTGTSAVFEL